MTIACNVVDFDDLIDSISAFGLAGNATGETFRGVAIALKELRNDMEIEYRKNVGNLPGSTRTSRLRKKRDKIVSEWFVNFENKNNVKSRR